MLMLSRKTNEAIMIGDDIRVTITHIGRGRVQIAVDAPREVRVRRQELVAAAPRTVAAPCMSAGVEFADTDAVVA